MTEDERSRIVSEMLRMNTLSYINTLGPLLLRSVGPSSHVDGASVEVMSSEGYVPEAVQEMQQKAMAEIQELRVHLHTRWSFAWAVKKPD